MILPVPHKSALETIYLCMLAQTYFISMTLTLTHAVMHLYLAIVIHTISPTFFSYCDLNLKLKHLNSNFEFVTYKQAVLLILLL